MELVPRKAFYRALGQLLAEHRARRGLSQRQLAAHIGAGASKICRVERAEREPSARLIWNISAALAVSPGALLREAAASAAQTAIP
jgi:transcriptional regulator with XRE-family HTH domain